MTPATQTDIRYGTKVGRFVVVGELGEGAMGVVFAAHDRELDRQIALKVLRSGATNEEDRTRMLREGQAMARVTHPNVITVYEVGVTGDLVFLAQELLDGGTLGRWLERPRPRAKILDKFIAAGRGLAAAHKAGLVHRDFKPDNVLLGKDGRVRVADFGLARALGASDDGATPSKVDTVRGPANPRNPMNRLTQTGAMMGTPMFMAPEQHRGERADERCDQFAFSVALYRALYGDWPFAGKTTVALADAVIEGRLQKPPRGHRVPGRLRRILLRGLQTNPQDRYPNMDALLADLVRPPSRKLHGFGIAVAALAVVAIATAGGYALRSRDAGRSTPAPVRTTFDPKTLAPDRSIEWLSQALERGQLDDAAEKYDMAAALQHQSGATGQVAIARAAGALVLALRGNFAQARTHLRDATAGKPSGPIAAAYADLAAATLAFGSGDLETAARRSTACATALATAVPELGAMCWEVAGDTAAERGDPTAARTAYGNGLAVAKRIDSPQRTMALELAVAALDLDHGAFDAVAAKAAAVQAAAAERGAVSTEQRAWVLLARAHLAQAASQQALDDLEHIKIAIGRGDSQKFLPRHDAVEIEPLRLRLEHRIALGQTYALLGDTSEGEHHLDQARAEAERAGARGLALAARLARLEVDLAIAAGEHAATQQQLIADARGLGYGRIARLTETAPER